MIAEPSSTVSRIIKQAEVVDDLQELEAECLDSADSDSTHHQWLSQLTVVDAAIYTVLRHLSDCPISYHAIMCWC